ncbi:MAG: hypothetical protein JRE62_00570, partial [Deltaproteobacteria bacterium]|nr:hypothetical protein [Deltaproteobacteria bacterium]
VDACWDHRRYLLDTGLFRQRSDQQTVHLFQRLVMERVTDKIFSCHREREFYQNLLDDLKNRKIDVVTAAEKLVETIKVKV